MSPEEAKYANDFMRLFWSMESKVAFHSLLAAGSIFRIVRRLDPMLSVPC